MEQRPLVHGRLLLSGFPLGADGLDAYDAACVALAMLDERYSATDMTMNFKGEQELLDLLKIGSKAEADMAAVAEMEKAKAEGRAPDLTGLAGELAEMEALMSPKSNPPASA